MIVINWRATATVIVCTFLGVVVGLGIATIIFS